jgi:nitrate/nitrite transport system substrate-binding protein
MDAKPEVPPKACGHFRYAVNFPWRSHAVWFLTQMIRWGQIEQPLDIRATAAAVYRPDLYRDAAKALGVPAPSRDDKTEGTHAVPWTLSEASAPIPVGPNRFFDGCVFDPTRPIDYLAGFDIRSPNIALAALVAANERATGREGRELLFSPQREVHGWGFRQATASDQKQP